MKVSQTREKEYGGAGKERPKGGRLGPKALSRC